MWRLVVVLVLVGAVGCGSTGPSDGSLNDGAVADTLEPTDTCFTCDRTPEEGFFTVPLTGVVSELLGASPTPVEGAVVSSTDGRGGTSTTGTSGRYLLSFSSLQAYQTFFIRAEKTAYFPKLRGLVLPANPFAPTATLDLELDARAGVERTATTLGTPLDAAKGIVIVKFNGTGTDGGYGANLSAAHDPSFTFDTGAVPTVSPTLLTNSKRDLVFFNVTAGTTTLTLTAPAGKTCGSHASITSWRVDADTILDVIVDCT